MNIDFYKHRKIYYLISALCIAAGLISLLVQGLNRGIDFQSGTLLDLKFNSEAVAMEQVREVLKEEGLDNSSIVQDGEGIYIIKSAEIDEAAQSRIMDSFRERLGEFELQRVEIVGPVVGRELARNGVIALIMAAILMLIYVSFRFQWKFAVAAILCLLHDVTIMLGVFSLFQYEVESSFIAAVLTIIGYSINDTIVIFDRIRENMKLNGKMKGGGLVNASINQTMGRSLNMAVTVFFVLLCLIFLGGETTRVFAIALMVGNIAGFYSSVFIAGNLWMELKPEGIKM
jgi:preprotein translocase subunit SecF